jgi:hypothetical protein
MGQALMKYYALIEKEGGMMAKMKLAAATRMPSVKAATEPDTADIVAAFRKAYQEITGKAAPMV